MPCPNAAPSHEVRRRFESLARRNYVGQEQAWNFVRFGLEGYTGLSPRSTCTDWVLHFTGPSGSGKSYLAELIAEAAFEPWDEEPYPRTQLALATTACAVLGSIGLALGPIGASLGCAAGAAGAYAALEAALTSVISIHPHFRTSRAFPAQCGVRQHKFSPRSSLAEVEAWEYRVAATLLREPKAVIILDDIGRLADAEAFEHLGDLLCGVGGNAVPEFRTGRGHAELVPASEALFVLTSDLELEPQLNELSCEVSTFESMLTAVRGQSSAFWKSRELYTPDWWGRLPIVPFRQLCPDELSLAARKYLDRQTEEAARRVEAELRRRREIFPGSMVDHRWIGSIRTGQRSFAVFDAYATEALALSELSLLGGEESQQLGGQGGLGGWMIAEFHHQVMRPAIAALTAADVDGETLVSRGGYKKQTSLLNSTTYTYMADVCLAVSQKPGQMPSVKFGLMGGYVCE